MAVQVATDRPNDGLPARIQAWPKQVREYFESLQMEMKRVTWPSRTQVQATTGVVIFTVFGFALYFWIVDILLARGINGIQHFFTR
ncbi:MAG: preprotein translocase subunit SecE [Bryobacterales bacterium]|nr:preprotein translocase subunit SecE [Bryobacterales bacterium]